MKKLSGAQIFVDCLRQEGVETIFGFPGGAVLELYDALYHSDIRHILVRHEQAAVHAADGFARATGRVGVCLVTSGPGATNTVTGLATAYMDSVPVIVFSGQVPTMLIGNDAFQEADTLGITRSCTKHNYLVKDAGDLARIIREAFHIARTGRPGPVVVDLPKDVTAAVVPYVPSRRVDLPGYRPNTEGHPGQIERALDLLVKARRPVLYVGGGVILSGAAPEVRRLAERFRVPVTMTLMGLGAFPGDHPLSLGMLGMHGTCCANLAISSADVVMAIGARFDDRVTGRIDAFAKQAKIVHIDIDPTSISKNVVVDVPIVGDARRVLQQILQILRKPKYRALKKPQRKEWLDQIETWKRERALAYDPDGGLKPQYVVEKIYELTRGEALITTEVGQNQMWAVQYYRFSRPRTLFTSGGLGTMGYGLPAAIGVQIARPESLVFDIAGDGSIQMNIQELATAVQYRLPVKIAILNNGYLGMVRQWQELFYGKRYACSEMTAQPDFVKLAEAYGAVGLRAEKADQVVPVLEQAIRTPRTVLIDFRIAREEGVYPMVPAGAPLTEMILL
ncbi:MAG: biosynthetic-type acetolactate synthase large subunit [bacterium]